MNSAHGCGGAVASQTRDPSLDVRMGHVREPDVLPAGRDVLPDDTVVPFQQTAVMADALKDAGKPFELVVLNKEDHWLSRAETRKQMLEAALAFVEKHNPPD